MSGLEFQTVPIAFTQGQDQRTQSKLVVAGKWLNLINYSLSADNTPRRRDGSQLLVDGTIGNGLALHGDELLNIDAQQLSAYAPSRTDFKPRLGELGFVNISRTPAQRSNGRQDSPDIAYGASGAGTYICSVWRELDSFGGESGINCSLVDAVSGTKLIENFQLRAGNALVSPRVVFSGGAFFLFYVQSTGKLYCRVIRPSATLTVGAEVVLVNTHVATANFDACNFGQASLSSAMVVYRWNDGITSVRSIQVSAAPGSTVPSTVLGPLNLVAEATIANANILGVCCASFTANLLGNAGCFVLHTGGVSGVVQSDAWVVTTAITLLDPFVAVNGGSITAVLTSAGAFGLQVFSDQSSNYNFDALTAIRTSIWDSALVQLAAPSTLCNSASFSGGAAPLASGPQGPFICGKAFAGITTDASGGNPVVCLPVCVLENGTSVAAPNNNTQCSFFLLDGTTALFSSSVTAGAIVAKALYGGVGVPNTGGPPVFGTPCSSPAVGGTFITLVNETLSLEISNGVNVSPTGLTQLTFTPNKSVPLIQTQHGPVTYFSGGQMCMYDGSRVVEQGFPLFPEGMGGKMTVGAGMTAGVHQFVAVYEWFDAQGERHQSSIGLPLSLNATGGNFQATLNIPTLLLSQKPNVNIVVYATQADGLVFNRLPLSGTHPAPNTTSAAFVQLVITAADSTFVGNEVLYTQPNQAGSSLPNDAPPPCKALTLSQNRLWLLSADNDFEYRYSQALLPGFGLQFSGLFGDETLGGLLPTEAGKSVAIASMDEKTIIFCQNKIYVVYGTPPDSNGENSSLTDPQEIPSPVGCSDPASILSMPMGLMFKAQSGWYLLSRGQEVKYIGEGVADYDSYVATSATLMQDRQECRFEVSNASNNGVCLVYSYLIGQWSVFQRFDADSNMIAASGALWHPPTNSYVFVNQVGGSAPLGLFKDVPLFDANDVPTNANPDDFVGSSGPHLVFCGAGTGWLKISALEGFQRVRRIFITGTPVNGTNVATTFTIDVDFDDDGNSSFGYTVLVPSVVQTSETVDLRHKLHHQKCKSVRFSFLEQGDGISHAVMAGIQALALEIGVKKGLKKLSAGQTV